MLPINVIDGPQFDYIQKGNPTIDVNPRTLYATWLNLETGELFICINNRSEENVWVGGSGLTIGKITVEYTFAPILWFDFKSLEDMLRINTIGLSPSYTSSVMGVNSGGPIGNYVYGTSASSSTGITMNSSSLGIKTLHFIGKAESGVLRAFFTGNIDNNYFRYNSGIQHYDGSTSTITPEPTDPYNWHHFTFVLVNSSTVRLFIDGDFYYQFSNSNLYKAFDIEVVGRANGLSSESMIITDELLVLDYALTDAEVLDLYTASLEIIERP